MSWLVGGLLAVAAVLWIASFLVQQRIVLRLRDDPEVDLGRMRLLFYLVSLAPQAVVGLALLVAMGLPWGGILGLGLVLIALPWTRLAWAGDTDPAKD